MMIKESKRQSFSFLRSLALFLVSVPLICGCAAKQNLQFMDGQGGELLEPSNRIFYVPLCTLAVEFSRNSDIIPVHHFSDSFFLDAANSLLLYEAGRYFTLCPPDEEDTAVIDSLRCRRHFRRAFSRISGKNEDNDLEKMSEEIRMIAEEKNADLILLPYSCVIKHIAFQPKGWRGGGPSYERPVSYKARANVHVQIWSRDGRLLFEKIGRNDSGRPVMYSLFGKKKSDEDVVKFARHFFAPPLVRALYKSIQEAMSISR